MMFYLVKTKDDYEKVKENEIFYENTRSELSKNDPVQILRAGQDNLLPAKFIHFSGMYLFLFVKNVVFSIYFR